MKIFKLQSPNGKILIAEVQKFIGEDTFYVLNVNSREHVVYMREITRYCLGHRYTAILYNDKWIARDNKTGQTREAHNGILAIALLLLPYCKHVK